MDKETQADITILLATFRVFNEQLYNIKGKHSKVLKLKFNRLLGVARAYESEIVKLTNNSEELEAVYDCIADIMLEVKEGIQ
jgi:hypothetical protein|tara:strand:+ start:1977 stop:2222 length:246 start_codon:yes stop_codon:yes gene_type:complete